jgi:hypothetical protein
MIAIIRNLFKPNKSSGQLPLGRWSLNNEKVKSLYANSDHCGDIICGNPEKIKIFVYEENSFKNIPNTQQQQQQQPQKDVYQNQDFCCMLLGLQGPCSSCCLMSNLPKINVT